MHMHAYVVCYGGNLGCGTPHGVLQTHEIECFVIFIVLESCDCHMKLLHHHVHAKC